MSEIFCKLADPQNYVACDWDLVADTAGRRHWVSFFKRHLETILNLAIQSFMLRGEQIGGLGGAYWKATECREEFHRVFNAFDQNPTAFGRVTILTLDTWRDELLRKHGYFDPFLDLKNRENVKMLPLLPRVCRQIDALSETKPLGEINRDGSYLFSSAGRQLEAIIRGVFAGNIFDMGAEATAKAFLGASPDFFATRNNITPRPWLIDDYDAFAHRMLTGKIHRKAVFFIDNAGSDFLLGALPMIRWMAQRGTQVVMAANDRPTLNDMTVSDVRSWWPDIVAMEKSIAGLPISFVGTGTGEPLIDLSAISPELNSAAADADLVILEGMGRGVESNLNAKFNCDALNIAMIKDVAVADRHGGKVFDVICRFRVVEST